MKNSQVGMTLVELIVVIGVITLVSGVLIDQTAATLEAERTVATQESLNNLSIAIRDFYKDIGYMPTQLAHLTVTTMPGGYGAARNGFPGFRGPYITRKFNSTVAEDNEVLYDKWRRLYVYSVSGLTCTIRSTGADRVSGNADDVVRNVIVQDVENKAIDTLRASTRDEMAVINAAIAKFYQRFPPPASPAAIPVNQNLCNYINNWANAMQQIVNAGLLPNNAEYLNDQFGTRYNFDGGKVTSSNVP